MKKIFKYIMSAALVLTGMMQLASCNDANDWTVDPSVTKQRPPTSLKVELADSASLNINVTIGTLQTAASYDLQVSESPLSSVEANDASTVKSAVWTFEGITVKDFEEGKYVIKRSKEDNGQFTVEQDKTYYFRARAVGKDGTKSNWFTNGLLYYGGVGDEALAQTLLENSYENNSNLNSISSLTTPALLWVTPLDVEPDAITVNWHEINYATPKYIRNENTGDVIDVSGAKEDTRPKIKTYSFPITGLEGLTSYTFSLLDEDEETVLGSVTASTEAKPNMDIARQIVTYTKDEVIGTKGNPLTLVDSEFGDFKIILHQNDAANAGWSTNSYKCMNPLKELYTSNNRFQSKNKNNITFVVPSDGRLYLYANGSPTTYTVQQEGEEDQTVTVNKDDKDDRGYYKFVKVRLKKGSALFKAANGKSCYYYGFVFVPDEE